MEISSVTLCDSAADYSGKLCILGAFDTIVVPQFPFNHSHCSVALRYVLRDEDVGRHKIQVALVGSDGQPLIPADKLPVFNVQVNSMPENVFFESKNLVLNFQGLPLAAPGQCEVRVLVDGQIVRTVPFQVIAAVKPS